MADNLFSRTVEITVNRLEELLEAEVRIEILKKMMEQEGYFLQKDVIRILGMEVDKDA